MRLWPSSEAAWKLLAADWQQMQQEKRTEHWANLRAEEAADAALFEPLSPEEEETLF